MTQYEVLQFLKENFGHKFTSKTIAATLQNNQQRVALKLNKLVFYGFIKKEIIHNKPKYFYVGKLKRVR